MLLGGGLYTVVGLGGGVYFVGGGGPYSRGMDYFEHLIDST